MSAKSRASDTTQLVYFTEQDIKNLESDCLVSIATSGDRWLINPMTDGRYVLSQYQVCDRQIIRQDYYRELDEACEAMLGYVSSMVRDLVY